MGQVTGKKSYQISSATWLLVHKEQSDLNQAKATLEFIKWAVTGGQQYSACLVYLPPLKQIQKLYIENLMSVTCNGTRVLK